MLLSVVPLVLFLYAADRMLRRYTTTSLSRQGITVSDTIAQALEDRIAGGETFLTAVAARPELRDALTHSDAAAAERSLAQACPLQQDFVYCVARDSHGVIRASYPRFNAPLEGPLPAWVTTFLAHPRPYVSGVYQPHFAPQDSFVAVAVPVKDAQGQLIGIVDGLYRLDLLTHWLRQELPSGTKWVTVVDQNGRIVSQPDTNGYRIPPSMRTYEPVQKVLTGDVGADFYTHDHQRVLVTHYPITMLHWGVLVQIPLSELDKVIWTFEKPLSIAASLFVVMALAFGLLGASLFRRLRESEEQIRRRISEESGRRYRVLFDASPLPKWLYDRSTLRFLDANEAAIRLYGYSREEFLRMTIRDLRPPDEFLEPGGPLAASTGQEIRRHVTRDGRLIQVDVRQSLIELEGKEAAVLIATDITDRLAAETKIAAQLERLNLLNQITRAIGERQDLRSIFVVVNNTLEEHMPLEFCAVCLYDPANKELTVASIGTGSLAAAEQLEVSEHVQIPIDENGLSRCVRGQLVYDPDVAEVPMPFPQRLARAGLRSFVAAPLLAESRVFGIMIAARRNPKSFSSGECEFLRQVSEHVALAAHQAQLYDALQDAYEDLRQTQQAVMQHERLRALGQMAGGIAHDINNAISPAMVYTDMILEEETSLTQPGRERLAIVQRAIGDIAQTVSRMSEFYRRQREAPVALNPVSLNSLANQVLELTRARWSDMPQQRGIAIEVRTELKHDLPAVAGVESEIREALINLVFNSVDALPEGGTIIVRSGVSEDGAGKENPRPGRPFIEVQDTGIGMEEETRRRALEPFFTTKGQRGSGLGLSMVYGIARRHGADVEIESEVRQGTVVRLTFPMPAPQAAKAVPDQKYAGPTRRRILVIDDDPLLIRALRDMLEGDGHAVTTAVGGQPGVSAFQAAKDRDEVFDLVITDLGMPHMDGRQVAAAIKAASPSTPVILLTGWGQRLAAEGEVPRHVDQVLSKPPRMHELRECIAQCRVREADDNGNARTA